MPLCVIVSTPAFGAESGSSSFPGTTSINPLTTKTMNWTAITKLSQLPNLQVINCDTRDFAYNSFDLDEKETKKFFSDNEWDIAKLKNLLLLNKKGKLKTDKYFISLEEILP